MLLTDYWKERVIDVIKSVYGDKINYEGLSKYLDNYISKSTKTKRIMNVRNVYKRETYFLEMNNVLDWIDQNQLIIGANGSFSESHDNFLGDTTMLISSDLDNRAIEKNIAKECEKNNDLKEAERHENFQLKFKQDTNSVYGIACQVGSFLYNPDAASYITSQSRQLISEVLWSFERLVTGNFEFENYDEIFAYLIQLLKEKRNFISVKEYITYKPTFREFYNYLLKKFSVIPDFYNNTNKISKSLFLFLSNLTEEDMIYLYYKNNLTDFLFKNPKVFEIFKRIMYDDTDFLNPNKIPEVFSKDIAELIFICREMVFTKIMTHNRVDKYFNKGRRSILLSDTDSVFLILSDLKKNVYRLSNAEVNQNNTFKIINTLCAICTDYMEIRHDSFILNCNTDWKFEKYKLNAKNEFYNARMVIYTGIKKNYSCYRLLREGNILPPKKQISHTGIKLISSTIHPEVSNFQTKLLEERILKSDIVNPIDILYDMNNEKKRIVEAIKNGDKTYGIPVRFSGFNKYKNVNSVQICRIVEIWNRLYPDYEITDGDYMLVFDTIITNENKLYIIKDIEMREKIRNLIYCDRYKGEPNMLKAKGISTIGIPKIGDMVKLPDWMIDIIDYETMCRRHLRAITDMLPSLGMNKTKMSGKDSNISSLISF